MTTEDQARALARSSRNASGAVLPSGLRLPATAPGGQHEFNTRVKQVLETGMGVRGANFDGWVTRREMNERLDALVAGSTTIINRGIPANGIAVQVAGAGGTGLMSFEQFAASIMATKLFRDLTASIDDPNRFDDLPEKVKNLLLPSIAEEARQRGAAIRRSEETSQSAQESLALTLEELTASVEGASAGVRRVQYASASANRATAGIVTQVQARLDNFSGGAPGTATVETKMTAVADRATGLEAQYTLKVATNGAIAGFGLAATTSAAGVSTSSMLFLADKFAFITSSDVLGTGGGQINPVSPPSSRIMFGIDSNGAYLGGNIKATGSAKFDGLTNFAGADWAMAANSSLLRPGGVYAFGSSIGATGQTITGIGLWGAATGVGIGVKADGGPSGTALQVLGPMTINTTAMVTNLNAELHGGVLVGNLFQFAGTVAAGDPGAPTHTVSATVGSTTFRVHVSIP